MGKRRLFFFIIILAIGVLIWQLPAILKSIPSRYVAAYLPEPMQALAAREQGEFLPTAVIEIDPSTLLVGEDRTGVEETSLNNLEVSEKERESATEVKTPIAETESSSTVSSNQTDRSQQSDPTVIPDMTDEPLPTPTETALPIPNASRLESFRHHFQTWNNCGPATLAMGLSHFDVLLAQEETAGFLKPNPEDRNVSPYEMVNFVNQETELTALERSNGDLETLRRLIAGGFPVIVELGLDPPGEYRWMGWYGHYLLVVAYDDTEEQVWVYDSWFGTSEVPGENADAEGRMIDYDDLDRYWSQFNRNYLVIFAPEDQSQVAKIIGSDMDDDLMWDQALVRTQADLVDDSDDPFLWFNLGIIYNAVGKYEKAALAFDQSRSLGIPWRMLWYQFGPYEAYYETGRFEDVILLADVTLKDRPYFEESYYYKGLAEAALGNLKEARDNLEKAARFNPNFAPAAQALAELMGI